ncbi:MAG TPA: exonuclease SbcCD subunit D [Streptosporangiaceae bacterium]|nr:exonuclease SbcCD subunit D [Streptosporangiaceae bacterium]
MDPENVALGQADHDEEPESLVGQNLGVMSVASAMVRAMLMLHTSDWHLGRSLHRADLRAAQAAFLDHLVDTVRSEHVDVVLVAGDIYDRAVPPVDAVELCEDALLRLHATGAAIVLISGNHDSARRLGFGSGLLSHAGVYVRTRASALAEPVMLADRHGPVAVYAVPYLEPDAVRGELPGSCPDQDARGHAGILGHAVRRIRADADARGVRRRVVMAHGWVTGGAPSDSERDITVGGVGQVPAGLFDGFGYAALGHLHGQQTIAGHVRYSGSPLPYSFSEAAHRKGSWLVELGGEGTVHAERVPAPTYRKLSVLRGRLADLLGSAAHAGHEDDFLSVTLTDPSRPEGAMDALRARFPHILVLALEPEGAVSDGRAYRARIAGRDDESIAAEFVRHVRDAPATEGERRLLAGAFEAVLRTQAEEAERMEEPLDVHDLDEMEASEEVA